MPVNKNILDEIPPPPPKKVNSSDVELPTPPPLKKKEETFGGPIQQREPGQSLNASFKKSNVSVSEPPYTSNEEYIPVDFPIAPENTSSSIQNRELRVKNINQLPTDEQKTRQRTQILTDFVNSPEYQKLTTDERKDVLNQRYIETGVDTPETIAQRNSAQQEELNAPAKSISTYERENNKNVYYEGQDYPNSNVFHFNNTDYAAIPVKHITGISGPDNFNNDNVIVKYDGKEWVEATPEEKKQYDNEFLKKQQEFKTPKNIVENLFSEEDKKKYGDAAVNYLTDLQKNNPAYFNDLANEVLFTRGGSIVDEKKDLMTVNKGDLEIQRRLKSIIENSQSQQMSDKLHDANVLVDRVGLDKIQKYYSLQKVLNDPNSNEVEKQSAQQELSQQYSPAEIDTIQQIDNYGKDMLHSQVLINDANKTITKDAYYEQLAQEYENAHKDLIRDIGAASYNSMLNSAVSLVNLPKVLDNNNTYDYTDFWTNTFNNAAKLGQASQSQRTLYNSETGEVDPTAIIPNLSSALTSMITLGKGAGAIEKGLGLAAGEAGATAAYDTGIVASSFAITHNDYYQQAKDKMTDAQASGFATAAALLTSSLELISPLEKVFGGEDSFAKIPLNEAMERFAKGESFSSIVGLGKNIVNETGQEVSQDLGDRFMAGIANGVIGQNALDTKYNLNDFLTTVTATMFATGLAGGIHGVDFKGKQRQEVVDQLSQDQTVLNSAVNTIQANADSKLISQDKASSLITELTENYAAKQALPKEYSDSKKSAIVDLRRQLIPYQQNQYGFNEKGEVIEKKLSQGEQDAKATIENKINEASQKPNEYFDQQTLTNQQKAEQVAKGNSEPIDAVLSNVNETKTPEQTAQQITNLAEDVQKVKEEKDLTIADSFNIPVVKDGNIGTISQDGQTVVFKENGTNKEIELGNIDEIKDRPLTDFGISNEKSVVSINDNNEILVRNKPFVNNFSDPLAAINKDDNGNVVSVNLETTDGKKRTFRGNIAEDIAYQINLKKQTQTTQEPITQNTNPNEQVTAEERTPVIKTNSEQVSYNGQNVIGNRSRPKSEKSDAIKTAREKVNNPDTNASLKAANAYNESARLPPVEPHPFKKSDPVQQTKISEIYQRLQDVNDPNYQETDQEREIFNQYQSKYPELFKNLSITNYKELVKASYAQLINEVNKQFDSLPVHVDFHNGDHQYESSGEMLDDVHNFNHLWVFKGGEDHTELGDKTKDANGITANDKFRAVHDYYGHSVEGYQFGKDGEENAWIEHSKMFSPLAQLALSSETRGQNSYVNYSEVNKVPLERMKLGTTLIREGNKTNNKEMIQEGEKLLKQAQDEFNYAQQKSIILPLEYTDISNYYKPLNTNQNGQISQEGNGEKTSNQEVPIQENGNEKSLNENGQGLRQNVNPNENGGVVNPAPPSLNIQPIITQDNATTTSTEQNQEGNQPAGQQEHLGIGTQRNETPINEANNKNSRSNSTGTEQTQEEKVNKNGFTHINKEDITDAKTIAEKNSIQGGKVEWKESVSSAIDNLAKEAKPGESLIDVATRKIGEWGEKIEKELTEKGKSTFNPSDEDLATMSYFRAKMNEQLAGLKDQLNSNNNAERLNALRIAKEIQEKIISVDYVLSESGKVAARSFYIRQMTSKMDTENNLQIRRMDIMRSKGGDPLSEEQENAISKLVSEENNIRKEADKNIPLYSQEDFEAKVKEEVARRLKEIKSGNKNKNNKEFNLKVDKIAEKLKKLLIPEHLRNVTKQGIGLNEIIDHATSFIKEAYKVSGDIKEAIDKAIDYIKEKLGSDWKKEFEAPLQKELEKIINRKKEILGDIEDTAKQENVNTITKSSVGKGYINDLVNEYINDGLRGKDLFNQMKKDLTDIFPSVTDQQIRDAYLKTGEYKLETSKKLDKDKTDAKNELSNIAKLENKLEDARKGIASAKNETSKRLWTHEENRIKSELQKELKNKNIELEKSPKEEIEIKRKVAESHNERMDSISELIKKKLEDKNIPEEERDVLKETGNAIELSKIDTKTAEKIDKALNKVETKLREATVPLEGGTYSDIADEIKKSLSDLKNESVKSIQDILLLRYKKSLENKIKEIQSKLDSGEFDNTPSTVRSKSDAEAIKSQLELNKIQSKYRRLEEKAALSKKTWWEKGIRLGQTFLVNELISGLNTAEVVAISGVTKQPFNTLTNATFGTLAHTAFPELSKGAGAEAKISLLQEKHRYMAHYAALGEEGVKKLWNDSKEKLNTANVEYNSIKEKLDSSEKGSKEHTALSKQLDVKRNNLDKALLNHQANFIYDWIGNNAWKDSAGVFLKGASQLDELMGKAEKVGWNQMSNLEKTEMIMGVMGAAHGYFKNFSARAEFAASFVARLENKQKRGVDIGNPDEILKTANESMVNYLMGKYQEDNYATSFMNKLSKLAEEVGNTPSKYSADQTPKNIILGKITAAGLRAKYPIVRTGVNIGREAIQEYLAGALVGGYFHGRTVGRGILNAGKENISLRESINKEISKMSPDRVDLIFRCYRKGGLGLVMIALAAMGYVKFGGFYGDEDRNRKKNQLKQGEVELFGHRYDHKNIIAKTVIHTSVFMPSLMIANTRESYNRILERKDRSTGENHTSEDAVSGALISDLGATLRIIPFLNTGLNSMNPFANPSVPFGRAAADISEYFDTDSKGNLIERKPHTWFDKLKLNTGFRELVPINKKANQNK